MQDTKQKERIYFPGSYTAESVAAQCPETPEKPAVTKPNTLHMTVIAVTENGPAGRKASIKNTSRDLL